VGVFDGSGLNVRFENNLSGTAQTPLLVWGNQSLRLKDLAKGESSQNVTGSDLNSPGVFTHGNGLVSESDRLHGQLIQAAQGLLTTNLAANTNLVEPVIIGWLSPEAAPALMNVEMGKDNPGLTMQAHVMVRAPLKLQASSVGSQVLVEGPFNRLQRSSGSAGLPLDRLGIASSNMRGEWVMMVVPPREIGRLKPTHAVLSVDLNATQYVMTVSVGQNGTGRKIASWAQSISPETVAFDVGPEDLSPDGYLVLRLKMDNAGEIPRDAMRPQWNINRIQVSLTGEVTGPATQAWVLPDKTEDSDVELPSPPPPPPPAKKKTRKGH
jgi:hypothetical protein